MRDDSSVRPTSGGSLTLLLRRMQTGDDLAQQRFCESVYNELQRIATRMIRQCSDQTIESTSLVNDLFVRYLERETLESEVWVNRKVFFTVAIESMRNLLIDRYRRQRSARRGGQMKRRKFDSLATMATAEHESPYDLDALENAMDRLKQRNSRQYQVVNLRFFGGMTVSRTAEILQLSVGTVERDWRLARVKLFAELNSRSHDA